MKKVWVFLFFLISNTTQAQNIAVKKSILKEGKYGITLQWISLKKRGVVQITENKNGEFQIKGEQKSKTDNDFLEIDGKLRQVSSKEIVFEGIIKTSVSYINKGNVCERNGRYTFIAKPGKKYWRLKESKNCEGGMVVDYIDLYL
jgi:hypothetical protein